MRLPLCTLLAALVVALVMGGCASVSASDENCSCAAGISFRAAFYQELRSTTVPTDDEPIGESVGSDACCGGTPGIPIYAITGVDPSIAIATKEADGDAVLNVASDLSPSDQAIADRLARAHRSPAQP